MQKRINHVIIDYQFHNADTHYSDGDIEDVLLEAAKNNRLEELLYTSNSWAVLYHCSDIRENLLEWYPFRKGASLLEIGSGCGALTGLFSRKVDSVTCVELSERRSLINAYRNRDKDNIKILLGNLQDIKLEERFDYITLIGVWEYAGAYFDGRSPYLEMLNTAKRYLKEDGVLLIAIENKMGIKYWNGAVEDHTGKMYSGLNDYVDDKKKVRTFSRPEIEELLKEAGWDAYRFYYPMPDYKLPEAIYSDERLPQPGELRNYRKDYNATHIYNFNDATVCDQLCSDKMISYFANSFLVECGTVEGEVVYAKYNRIRKKKYQIATTIVNRGNHYVIEKRAIMSEAKAHLEKMAQCRLEKKPNIHFANGYLDKEGHISDYIDGKDLDTIFYQYRLDAELFIEKTREAIQKYINPDEAQLTDFVVTEEYKELFGENYIKSGRCLKSTNLDMIFSNIRIDREGIAYCVDCEWVYDFPIPIEYVIWRAVIDLYSKYMIYLRRQVSRQDYLVAVGVNPENIDIFQKMEETFVKSVYGKDYLSNYRKQAVTYDLRFL